MVKRPLKKRRSRVFTQPGPLADPRKAISLPNFLLLRKVWSVLRQPVESLLPILSPPVDRRMVDRYAALFHHLFDVPVAQQVGHITSDADEDDIDRECIRLKLSMAGRPQF